MSLNLKAIFFVTGMAATIAFHRDVVCFTLRRDGICPNVTIKQVSTKFVRFEHDDFEDPTNQKCIYTIDNSCAFELALNIETSYEVHRGHNEMTGWVSPNHLTQGISVGIWQMCVAYRMST